MDPKYLKEYSSEQNFVLYEAGAYSGLCGDMVVFRALGGKFARPSIDLIFLGLCVKDYFSAEIRRGPQRGC